MEQRNYKLYLHITPNGKRYYGITKMSLKRRWQNGQGYKNNQHFTNAINKYGWDNIEHIILFDSLTEHEAKELEQYFIQWHDTANPQYGYNNSLGGESGNHSEISKKKMSEAKKGHIVSEETKRKISKSRIGKYTGENNPNYGKHHNEETKKKMSENHPKFNGENNPMYGKHHTEETKRKKSRPIICITTKEIFYGANEAQRQLGVGHGDIIKCCQGKRKSAGKLNGQKLVWRYLNHKHNKRYRIKNENKEL